MEIILASKSERRQKLLDMMGVKYKIIVTDADESADGIDRPDRLTLELSKRKAESALKTAGGGKLIIAADTVVYHCGKIFGKPADESDAKRMLTELNNSTHEVYTGLTVTDGERTVCAAEKTIVKFRNAEEWEIDGYIATGDPMDKAGAYGAQGKAAAFIERIEGDFFNVVGLPVCRLSVMLKEFGIRVNGNE